ncbi:hypothetical protein ACIRU3_08240 [Streptomyces sp. NPDC101151]|uniref:hypothetical protein n=1 Tax=Streptomyces sp. NPDC101151 TaxID=3366115 RepID=UPI0037F8E16D
MASDLATKDLEAPEPAGDRPSGSPARDYRPGRGGRTGPILEAPGRDAGTA